MNGQTEAGITTAATILVLFTAMLDPMISLGLAVAALLGLAIYNFAGRGRREQSQVPQRERPEVGPSRGRG